MGRADQGPKKTDNSPYVVAALYKFVHLPDYANYRERLTALCRDNDISGTLLLAIEGINGTIAGSRSGIDTVLSAIRELPGLAALDWKESHAASNPFYRMKVRLKKEIVTMGVKDIDPNRSVGTYIEPKDWNALINDPDTIVIDTRNDYEVDIGTFQGAIDPKTPTFRDFPAWFKSQKALSPEALSSKKLAMFCTGGIRCEKSTAFAKQLGIEAVYHLKGGILKYLEEVPKEESLWQGECFVFDQRVSVGHGLELGHYDLCRACRRPISEADKRLDSFEEGVSCKSCINEYSDEDRLRFRSRHIQIQLAEARGDAHLGVEHKPKSKIKPNTIAPLNIKMSQSDQFYPVLYSFRRCPYAMRARLAIAVSGQSVRLREVVLRDKPDEMLALSPKGTVPVLHLTDGQVIDESLDVMSWALKQNDAERWLIPDNGSLEDMLALIRENDGPFKAALDRYKYPNRYEAEGVVSLDERDKGGAFLLALEARLGNKSQLFGDRPSLADMAIFPFVRQYAATDRNWFDAQPWPNLIQWLNDHLNSDLFKSIMAKYPQWRSGDVEPIFPNCD